MAKTARASFKKNKPDVRKDGLDLPETFGEIVAADQQVLSDESDSMLQHRHAVSVQGSLLVLD